MTKKTQVPSVGGIRKMLIPSGTAVGTTIAELGSNTVTLAQLAALIAAVTPPANTGGGNIGTGKEASIALGPGLSGGGTLIGNVPIRLVAPPAFIAEDGVDGDPGMQGIQGPRGLQGLPGATWFAEDGADGDQGIQGIQGLQGIQGPAGAVSTGSSVATPMQLFDEDPTDNDTFGVMPVIVPIIKTLMAMPVATSMIYEDYAQDEGIIPDNKSALGAVSIGGQVTVLANPLGGAGNRTIFINAINTGDARIGVSTTTIGNAQINFDTNGVQNWVISNFRTDGSLRLSASQTPGTADAVVITPAGNTTITGYVGVRGAIPAVTAGQTDIGTTTTTTVITTAGGVAIPALAATMWRINVNGVTYGVPCFAL